MSKQTVVWTSLEVDGDVVYPIDPFYLSLRAKVNLLSLAQLKAVKQGLIEVGASKYQYLIDYRIDTLEKVKKGQTK